MSHGTSKDRVEANMKEGFKKHERHHVHLSQNVTPALQVGSRHGHAFILKIHSGKMHEDGYVFYLSANEVWLTDCVPPGYIEDDF
jgi:putative RNA 2'-phosphotransferase